MDQSNKMHRILCEHRKYVGHSFYDTKLATLQYNDTKYWAEISVFR